MKKHGSIATVITLLVLFTISCFSQWKRTDGPGGGRINAMITNGDMIYAGTWMRGIYRSTNGGLFWEESNRGLARHTEVKCFAAQGDTVYAGTFARGVYRSVDGGRTWSPVNANLPPLAFEVNVLLVVGSNIFLGAYGGGIWVSSNGGGSWARKTSGMSDIVYVYSLAYKDGRLFASTAPQGMFRSDNMGEHWELLTLPFAAGVLHVTPNYIFAGAGADGIRRSSDNGVTWTDVSSGLPLAAFPINTITTHKNTTFISTPAGVFMSVDWGNTWAFANSGLPLSVYSSQVSSFAQTQNELFASVGGSGVYKRVGNRWIEHNRGLNVTDVSKLHHEDGLLYAATRTSGIFRSYTIDKEWQTLDTNRSFIYFDGIATDKNRIFASASGYGLYKSLDKGKTWSVSSLPIQSIPYPRKISIVGNTIIVGLTEAPGIVMSFNNGSTWNIRNSGLSGSALSVSDVVHHNGVLYAGTGGGVYVSDDFGNNWQLRMDVPTSSLHFVNNTLFVGSFGGGIIRSEDFGNTWVWINEGLSEGWITSITSVRGVLFASSLIYGAVFASKNNGNLWENIAAGLPDSVGIRTLANDGRNLYAGLEWYGVWYLPLEYILPPVDQISDFRLYQNYPNPFNSSTTIKYCVSEDESVTLKIYNVLGQHITTLVNHRRQVGEYDVVFNAFGYPCGVYYYRMVAGTYAETRKLVLIK